MSRAVPDERYMIATNGSFACMYLRIARARAADGTGGDLDSPNLCVLHIEFMGLCHMSNVKKLRPWYPEPGDVDQRLQFLINDVSGRKMEHGIIIGVNENGEIYSSMTEGSTYSILNLALDVVKQDLLYKVGAPSVEERQEDDE